MRSQNSDSPQKEEIIVANGLTKRFGETIAVDELVLSIPRGTIFGFIGPSGCGKTTTVRLFTGYYRPTSGEVTVFGVKPAAFSMDHRERIGYMNQQFIFYPNLSVWENLSFSASIYGVKILRKKQLNQVLAFVELDSHKNKLARNLSGGMKRRLSLATYGIHQLQNIMLRGLSVTPLVLGGLGSIGVFFFLLNWFLLHRKLQT